jgi:hypothetical protein
MHKAACAIGCMVCLERAKGYGGRVFRFRGLGVSRYFFTIRWSDHDDDDRHGTELPDDAAALGYADRIIRELKDGGGLDDPGLMMVVKNEMHMTVLSLPFLAGCA